MHNTPFLKKVLVFIIASFSLFSCKQSESVSIIPDEKPRAEIEQFGFKSNEFNILNDTIRKGDTFGSIIENQNLGGKKFMTLSKW